MNGAALARQVQDRIALRVRIGSVEGSHTFCVATGCFVACCFCRSFPAFRQMHKLELMERAIPAKYTPLRYSIHISFRLGELGCKRWKFKAIGCTKCSICVRVLLENVQDGKHHKQKAETLLKHSVLNKKSGMWNFVDWSKLQSVRQRKSLVLRWVSMSCPHLSETVGSR